MNKFAFSWNEFVCKYHKTVGCTFWQPQGSRFTAKFGIGAPPDKEVSLTRYQVGVGLDPINEEHTMAGMWKMNKFAFFWYEFVCKYH